jgi:hypothetical protein
LVHPKNTKCSCERQKDFAPGAQRPESQERHGRRAGRFLSRCRAQQHIIGDQTSYTARVLRIRRLILGLLFGVLSAAPTQGADVTGAQVRRAIQQGVRAIRSRQNADGGWTEHSQPGGSTCLAALALLQAGESPDSPVLSAALRNIRRIQNERVYTTSLKIMVLARVNRPEDRRLITEATQWLIGAQNRTGLWTYEPGGDRFDHSNSQFALLGLNAAAEAGVKIPAEVWQKAQGKVLGTQGKDGGWGYQVGGPTYGSMTAAGVSDLLILGNRLIFGQEKGFTGGVAPNCGHYRVYKPLGRGLDWLGHSFRADTNPGAAIGQTHYWLYAVERCGILSGQQLFGRHDWYREGAEFLVSTQQPSGMWNSNLVDTCFALLFLAKGHAPLLVQKLAWSEDEGWNLDRYDLAHLVAYLGDQLGEPVAWQSVRFDAPLEDWLAAPLLYMQGHEFPTLNDVQRKKLRKYVEQGGTILAEACCGREEFRTGFREFAAAAFPETPLRRLGPEHAVFHVLHKIDPPDPASRNQAGELMGLDFGCRTSVIFSPRDMSCLWEQADVAGLSERAFKLGANIAAYAVGRRPLRDKLDVVVLPKEPASQPAPPAGDVLQLAQVVYPGDWRPFPLALVRLAEFLRDDANLDVVTQYRQVRLTDADLYTSPILYIAGHFDFEFSPAERQALADHLRRGGFLIADACCGTEPFETGLRRLVEQLFPESKLEKLPAEHPIFAGSPGFDVRNVQYGPDVARRKSDLKTPELYGAQVEGRLAIVYSPYSLSCGLSGPAFDGCWGLASDDAKRLTANIVLYAMTH